MASVIEAPAEDGVTMVQYGKIKVHAKKIYMKLVEESMDNRLYVASHLKVQVSGKTVPQLFLLYPFSFS